MLNKAKSTVLIFSTCLAFAHLCFGQSFTTPRVDVAVTVLDEQGIPIADAEVRGLYKGVRAAIDDTVDKKTTPSNGVVQLSGKSFWPVSVTARKEGYYDSEKDVKTFARINKKNVYSDQGTTLVLREVRNPIPMYAYRIDTQMHDTAKPKGFDLMKGDWVEPYGKGEIADVVFSITGFYKDKFNYDSTLLLNFPNEGDGIVSFEADEQSQFRSPYEALKKGYLGEKQLRKLRHPKPGNPEEDEITDDSRHDANYMFRIRTELDENGEVVSALYGKIYGNFSFGGATEKASYLQSGDLYLNPTPNDRNLEFDPSQNLFPGERVEDP
jgi:hypothetical protein